MAKIKIDQLAGETWAKTRVLRNGVVINGWKQNQDL